MLTGCLWLPEPPLANLGECGGQGYQPLRFRLNVGRSERWRQWKTGDFMGAPEHLLHQAGSRNKHVVHFAIQAIRQARKSVQRDGPVRLGLFQFAGPLGGHTQTLSQRFGTHAQRQSNRLCPPAPGRGMALQLREIAKLPVKFSQTVEVQAVFQGAKDLRQQAGCLPKRIGATGLFPLSGGIT